MAHDLLQQEIRSNSSSLHRVAPTTRTPSSFHSYIILYSHTRLQDHSYGKKKRPSRAPTPPLPSTDMKQPDRKIATRQHRRMNERQSISVFSASWVSCQSRVGGKGTLQREPRRQPGFAAAIVPSDTPYIPTLGERDKNLTSIYTSIGWGGGGWGWLVGCSNQNFFSSSSPPPHLSFTLEHGSKQMYVHGHMNIVRSFRTSQSALILLYPLRSPIPPPPPFQGYNVNREKLKKKKTSPEHP